MPPPHRENEQRPLLRASKSRRASSATPNVLRLSSVPIAGDGAACKITMHLEDLQPRCTVRGVHPDGLITVVSVQ